MWDFVTEFEGVWWKAQSLRRIDSINMSSNLKLTDRMEGFFGSKEKANVFVSSKIILIYGAAGTGKTTLINYISNLMAGRSKLFLTKTHTALQNLQRRIDNPGPSSDFISIDSFTKRVNLPDYDIIFVDECSTIDNRTMSIFLEKMNSGTFLVLAGDIYQIESIDFGNWFFYAKDIIKSYGANIAILDVLAMVIRKQYQEAEDLLEKAKQIYDTPQFQKAFQEISGKLNGIKDETT